MLRGSTQGATKPPQLASDSITALITGHRALNNLGPMAATTSSADALLQAGDRAFVEEEYEVAAARFREAVAQSATSPACEALASALIKLERWLEASEAAAKALTADPSNAKACLRKG